VWVFIAFLLLAVAAIGVLELVGKAYFPDKMGNSPALVNDVLIALSARSIGANVLTSNARDFAAIRAVRPFKFTVVPA
jgi:predicted nucleic acid-binding protein